MPYLAIQRSVYWLVLIIMVTFLLDLFIQTEERDEVAFTSCLFNVSIIHSEGYLILYSCTSRKIVLALLANRQK